MFNGCRVKPGMTIENGMKHLTTLTRDGPVSCECVLRTTGRAMTFLCDARHRAYFSAAHIPARASARN
jgi:hypothetical protein